MNYPPGHVWLLPEGVIFPSTRDSRDHEEGRTSTFLARGNTCTEKQHKWKKKFSLTDKNKNLFFSFLELPDVPLDFLFFLKWFLLNSKIIYTIFSYGQRFKKKCPSQLDLLGCMIVMEEHWMEIFRCSLVMCKISAPLSHSGLLSMVLKFNNFQSIIFLKF